MFDCHQPPYRWRSLHQLLPCFRLKWSAAPYALCRTMDDGSDGIGHRDHREHQTPITPMLPMPYELRAADDPLGDNVSDIPPETEAILMTAVAELLRRLSDIGASIHLAGDNLILRTGTRPVPAELVRRLRADKAEVLVALSAPPKPHASAWWRREFTVRTLDRLLGNRTLSEAERLAFQPSRRRMALATRRARAAMAMRRVRRADRWLRGN